MILTIAAVVTSVGFGVTVNLVSNYFVPMASKKRLTTLVALAASVVLTIFLTVFSEQQVTDLLNRVKAFISATLNTRYGWILVLVAVVGVVVSVFMVGRRTLSMASSPNLDPQEAAYLKGVIAEVDNLNARSSWKDDLFVDPEAEIVSNDHLDRIRPSYYLVQKLKLGVESSDFENLPNAEKVENSRGVSYRSFAHAARRATDSATVVLAAPGAGKTVTLRRLAADQARSRLKNGPSTPILVNLAYYTGWRTPEQVESFEDFLRSQFATGYRSWLSDSKWETLLREGRCVFILDGLDEMPRAADEYVARALEVERFVRSWPGTRFYLSCRELDYDYRLGFQQILIKPFDLRRVKKFTKLTFGGQPELHAVSGQIWQNPSLLQLAKVPFYLNLICGYIRANHRIPADKSQLFSFVVDRVMTREVSRRTGQKTLTSVEEVIEFHSRLAATMSLETMSRTLSLKAGPGRASFADEVGPNSVLRLGTRSGLLEHDLDSDTIRFAHHRFQEYFCAIYLAEQLHLGNADLPPDFFFNIWWRETILMIASVDPDPEPFVRRLLESGARYRNELPYIEAAIKMDTRTLAHECLLSSDATKNSALLAETRNELISAFATQNPSGKMKILDAMTEDPSRDAMSLLETAEKDRSAWISEKAFFIRSAGSLRFRPTFWGATKEFTRFLLAGRIFSNARSVLALAFRFPEMRWLVPLYFLFAAIGFGAVTALAVLALVVGKFLMFDLHYSMSVQCLQCLFNVSAMAAIIAYLLTRHRPWLQRFLVATPISLMCWFLVFNIPDEVLLKVAGLALGGALALGLERWGKDSRATEIAPQGMEPYVIGVITGLFLAGVTSQVIAGDLDTAPGPAVASLPLPVMTASLALIVLLFVFIVSRDLLVIRSLRECRQRVNSLISEKKVSPDLVAALAAVFSTLKAHSWAQRVLLDHLLVKLAEQAELSPAARLEFLFQLGDLLPSSRFRDILYQRCDELEANMRRAMGDTAHPGPAIA
ncbi:NACHT domain-containing protein [Amycolatopsis pretoriensis]|uniref:NACHT domain-containing protein n=1 Tax=Amycolatopsis pretoriensis TaxID=218821 RepID=A0A1H5Q6G6_9PSEU|nr:NACHT domain-containing protein [Amycolatopsis pretoriensis]SEF20857.1 NACHT domain-containing protein [Amycolatopsis pretoriensis]